MTALAGLWYVDGRPARDDIARMLAAQRHYGPDDCSSRAEGEIALGRQLMRVLPEDAFDRQPLSGGSGRFLMVADARIDNREELAEALSLSPDQAGQTSDASFVLKAFERWDEKCLDRLLGDFAFAVWDTAREQWFLARDAMGARPLHYYSSARCFAFASMPKGLHALGEVPYEPDEELLARGLDLIQPDKSASCFRHILKVRQGHSLTVRRDGVTLHQYWSPPRTQLKLRSAADYQEALREQLERAVRSRLRGSADVGAHLSAGLDSSAVASTAARLLAGEGRRVVAFTSVPRQGFTGGNAKERIIDEGSLAAQTAALYPNMDHVLIRTEGRSPLDGLDRAFHLYEQPMLNLCNYTWLDALNDAARARGVRTMLTGATGNMTLSYNGYELLPQLLRRGRWLRLAREAFALRRHQGVAWRNIVSQIVVPFLPEALWRFAVQRLRSGGLNPARFSMLAPARRAELQQQRSEQSFALSLRPRVDSWAMRLEVLHRMDMANYYKGMLAHWRLDYRDPTADRRLIEFCLSVPTEQYLRNGQPSALARVALADRLPKSVLEERRKGLQAADWYLGMEGARDRLVEEVNRLAELPPTRRMLDIPRLTKMVEEWPAEGWEKPKTNSHYRLALLRGISTAHFLRRATRSNG